MSEEPAMKWYERADWLRVWVYCVILAGCGLFWWGAILVVARVVR